MKVRVALATCAGIVLVTLAVWAALGRSETARTVDRPRAPANVTPPPVAETPSDERPPDPAAAPEDVEVEGTVVVLDANGGHATESGHLLLRARTGPREVMVNVPVEDGRWKARVPRASECDAFKLTLGGHLAIIENPRFAAAGDEEVSLRAWWAASFLLHVVADETGAPLAEIEVVGNDAFREREFLHPTGLAELTPVATHARSPVTIPESSLATYWVRAPGRAWGRVAIDASAGGERTVRLVLGGAVDAQLSNFVAGSGAVLRLYRRDWATPAAQTAPDAGGQCVLEDLCPGRYEARAEIGPWFEAPLLLASAPVDIVAGARAFLALDLADASTGILVPLAGTLTVPAEWGDVEPDLQATPLPESGGRRPPTIRLDGTVWSAGSVAPGTYLIEVDPFGVQKVVFVPLGGSERVHITIPPPADVVVFVVDEETADPVRIEALRWAALPDDTIATPRRWNEVTAGEKPGTFRLRAPQGTVLLRLPVCDFYADAAAVRVGTGVRTATWKVRRSCGIRILLRQGETPVPVGPAFRAHASPVEGEGKELGQVNDGTTLVLRVSLPGPYRLRFGEVAGFAPIPERTVEAPAGKTIDVVIPLAHR